MTYHDKLLVSHKASKSKERRRYFRSALRGINDLTLNPSPVRLPVGSLEDDWRAVGEDMRVAMSRVAGE